MGYGFVLNYFHEKETKAAYIATKEMKKNSDSHKYAHQKIIDIYMKQLAMHTRNSFEILL